MAGQVDVVKFFGEVVNVTIESGPMNDRSTIVHVNDEGMREGRKTSRIDDGQIALRPDTGSMGMAEKKETCRGTIAINESSGVMDRARPVVEGDEDSPGLGEKFADHERLSGGAWAGVVIVEGGDHFRLFDE